VDWRRAKKTLGTHLFCRATGQIHSLPVMDGYQATIAIRAFKNANNLVPVPIISVTANVYEAGDRQG
jgi:hypothetical protein